MHPPCLADAAPLRPTYRDVGQPANRTILTAEDRGFDLPLDAVPRGGRPVHRDGANAAGARLMSDQPGIELAGFTGGEAEQEVELPFHDGLRAIHARIRHDKMAFVG